MIKQTINWHLYLTGVLGLFMGLALQVGAQTRGGGGGGGFGGGGFGGGGFGGGGGSRSSTSSSSAGSTSWTYPNNTTIGDAYFSIDPETHRVVYIADEATAKYIGQVLTNLDRPKPQVLIKVVFLEVTLNNSSDIGIEGTYGKSFGSSYNSGLVTNFAGVNNAIVPTSITPGQSSSFMSASNIFGLPGSSSAFSGANGLYQVLGQDYRSEQRHRPHQHYSRPKQLLHVCLQYIRPAGFLFGLLRRQWALSSPWTRLPI